MASITGDPATKWEVDAGRVNEILTGLTIADRLAVLDVVERVWADQRGARIVLQKIFRGDT